MTDTITRLKKLLDTERQALKSGDLVTLQTLVAEKTALTDEFETEQPAIDHLRQLRHTLKEHGQLIQAAQAGVTDVVNRLKAQREARASLQTYDKNGRGARIGLSNSGTERRF